MDQNLFNSIEDRCEDALRPLRAIIEITHRCPFNCDHCFLTRSGGDELTGDEIRTLIDRFHEEGVMLLTFTGGEPFLRKDFADLANYASEKPMALRILTNAAMVDEGALDRLPLGSLQMVEVSLYGASPETYERVTGDAKNFTRTLKGMESMNERGLPVHAKFTVLPSNCDDVFATEAMAAEFDALYSIGFKTHPREDGSRVEAVGGATLKGILDEWYSARPVPRRNASGGLPMCDAARRGIVVSAAGEVYPCGMFRRSAGNVRERDVYEIWEKSSLLRKIRSVKIRDLEKCGACEQFEICGRCAALSLAETGDAFGANDQDCRCAAMIEELLTVR